MSFDKAQDLVQLAVMASGRRGVSLLEIEAEFGRTRRTAQRMIDALQTCFPSVRHETDDEGRRRWILPVSAVAQFLTPTADELVAVSAAIEELRLAGNTTEAARLRSFEAKVRALIPGPARARLAPDEEALLEALGHAARPGPRPAVQPDVDAAISKALKGGCQLRIHYPGRGGRPATPRTVEPYGLLLGVRRYLVARDTAKPEAGLLHYKVEEIETAECLNEGFVIDPGFSLRAHAQKAFGSYVNDSDAADVAWRFTPAAAARARRFVFHPTQTVEEGEDGSLTVRFTASGSLEMCWHLYAWGDAVEVLEPESLRARVQDHRRSDFESLP